MQSPPKSLSDDRFAAAQFRALLDSPAQGIVAVDAAGTIQLASRQAEAMFGYARGELLGQSVEALVPERIRDIHAEERKEYSGHSRAMGLGMELRGRRRDGTEIPIEISLNPVQAGDEVMTIGLITDITERIELEEQVRQAQKMEAVGQLARGVAHQFNKVLTVISGCSRLALEGCRGDPALRGLLEEISVAVDRAALLTQQLRWFSGGHAAEPQWFDPNRRMSQMLGLLHHLVGEHVELELALGRDVGEILADPLQVDQMIVNLVQNARDAMPDGGSLTIATSAVEIGEDYAHWHLPVNPGPYVLFTVTDTGRGMTSEEQARMFEPFFTTKSDDQGTGLGLATVYCIVKDSGGSIFAASQPGQGTTIHVILPRIQETHESGHSSEADPSNTKSSRSSE